MVADNSFEAIIETTAAAGRRLVDALANGTREFVLSATDGSLSIRARLRVAGGAQTRHSLAGRMLMVDWAEAAIEHDGYRARLSRTELRLLATFLESGLRPLTRSELIEGVWPNGELPDVEREGALLVYICGLRKRLKAIGLGHAIATVRGVGYQLMGDARR
jgi:DNA-binding response OmpR family regulator